MNRLDATVTNGELRIRQGRQSVLTAWAKVRLDDGRLLSSRDREERGLKLAAVPLPSGALELVLTFQNTGRGTVRIEQLVPLVTESVLGSKPARLCVGEMGWQSWSRPFAPLPFRPDSMPVDLVRDPIATRRLPDSQVSAWMALLAGADGRELLFGFTRAIDFTGVVEIAAGRIQAWCDVEGLSVPPGGTVRSEPLLIASGVEAELLTGYAEVAASRMGARHAQVERSVHPGPGPAERIRGIATRLAERGRPEADYKQPTVKRRRVSAQEQRRQEVPTGWCSWYHFYTNVTEEDVRRNLVVLSQLRDELPIDVFQLDDGYQREVGDWLSLNDKFPSGMPALVASIREHGFTPGIWLAPFLLSARSKIYAEHPDWAVRGEDGSPLSVVGNWESDNYALDTTNPEALDWLEHVVRTISRDWGYEYLKIDFIFAAAVRGLRRNPEITAVQAYRRGVERIRAVAGERFILGCGAPFLPSVGLVDGMRVGEDVAPFWKRANNAGGPAMNNALQSTLLHNWMHRRWWINDPDCVMVRAHDSQLTLKEVQSWAGVVALSGGMVLVSDDLASVEPDRVELLGRLLPPYGERSDALPPYADGTPERLRLAIERLWGKWWVLGQANWSDQRRPAVFDPLDWGLPAGTYHVVDLWSGTHVGRLSEATSLGQLEPHEMRLLSVHQDAARPQVVGSTGHLLGDAMDVVDERWDGSTLTVQLAGPRPQRGEILVYVPDGFESDEPLRDHLRRLPFDLAQPQELRLVFRTV